MSGELRLESVTCGYGHSAVVQSLSARCPRNVITGMLGANGAGKTTLLRSISGYLPLRSGTIHLNGTELSDLSFRDRARHIACVPQISQDSLPLSVREAVRMARYPHLKRRLINGGDVFAAVDTAISDMGLIELADRQCSTLSGGEWRRVLIAQGLAQETPVLLLDEPTAFLDPPSRRMILDRVRGLAQKRNLTVVAVLHDIDLAAEYCGHALLLRGGDLLASGSPADVLSTGNLSQLYDCEPQWLGSEVTYHA